MKKITIDHFGPIRHCELETKDFMIFMGPQASGKSTVAKIIFFFKNIGNLLTQEIRKNELYHKDFFALEEEDRVFSKDHFIKTLQFNFQQIFGDLSHLDQKMKLVASYSQKAEITISVLQKNEENYLDIRLSKEVEDFIEEQIRKNVDFDKEILKIGEMLKEEEKKGKEPETRLMIDRLSLQLERNSYIIRENLKFFSEGRDVIYIPAGRSIMTLLSTQWDYLYTTMDDRQKRNIDYCTQNYLERILKLKSAFKESLDRQIEMLKEDRDKDKIDFLYLAKAMMEEILQGEYQYNNGEERLQISDKCSVKINFASSGQQEALWILNILFDALLWDRKVLFIIEEPESNLFPNAQKLMTEFIALAQNNGKNQILITTHSPYILGTVNNLLYAKKIENEVDPKQLGKIISKHKRIDFQNLSAFFMENDGLKDCTDKEFGSIENEVIDSASDYINQDFEKMLDLKQNNQ